MKRLPMIACVALALALSLGAQELSRQQKFEQIGILNKQAETIMNDLLRPTPSDIEAASADGLNVFRIMPRELYGRVTTPQQGGAYYSFSTGSHDYQKIAQVGLEQNSLKVGFAGADYGFIGDLGTVPLSDIDHSTVGVSFLAAYKPPKLMADIRSEQRRSNSYETAEFKYSSYVRATVGHSYVLRAISFDRADILVVFTVVRKDDDGSLIVFWKQIADFGKPYIMYAPDNEIKAVIDRIIAEKGLRISVDVKDNQLIWLGSPTNEEMRELRIGLQGKEVRIRGEDFSKRSVQK